MARFKYDGAGRRTDTWWRTNATNTVSMAHTRSVFGAVGNLAQQWTSVKSNDSNRQYDVSSCKRSRMDWLVSGPQVA